MEDVQDYLTDLYKRRVLSPMLTNLHLWINLRNIVKMAHNDVCGCWTDPPPPGRNDPLVGEWIRPRESDIFQSGHLRRRHSCPDILAYPECKLDNKEGYFLWEDLFKMMNDNLGFPLQTQSTHPAVEMAIQKMAKLGVREMKNYEYKSWSISDLKRFAVENRCEKTLMAKEKGKIDYLKMGLLNRSKHGGIDRKGDFKKR